MFLDKLLLFFPIRVIFPLFVVLVFVLTGFYFGYSEMKYSYEKVKKEKLNYVCSAARDFQETAEFYAWKNSIDIIEKRLVNISADPYIDIILISDPDGRVILSSKRKYINKNYADVIKKYAGKNFDLVSTLISQFNKKTALFCRVMPDEKIVVVAPVIFNEGKIRNQKIGLMYLQYNLKEIKELTRNEIITKILKYFGILFVVFIVIYAGFNKLVGERINAIVSATQKIAKGDLDTRIDLKGRDEFALIADVINHLVERLSRYINYDYLTGILNRFGLEREIRKAISKNSDLWNVFVLIDIDNFKDINDTFGHNVGDLVLKAFSKRLTSVAQGRITGRLGGDEFVIFFQTENIDDVEGILKKWMNDLMGSFSVKGNRIDVFVTAGISIKKGNNANFYDLLKESDIALYYGKRKGKKIFVIFDEEIRLQSERKIKLTEILKRSLRNGDFYLVFQPIIDLKSKTVYSVEALLRMKNKELGEISPAEFIPILEETGMIKEVGYWVIEEVCRQIKKWEKEGIDSIFVSINVDIQQLLDKDFVKNIQNITQKYQVQPFKLTLEITESEAMKFPETVIGILRKLKDMGIKISIDDFGTGYSSLSYLKMMPVSYIKIDRSFVKNIPNSREDNILVMTVVNLSKSFGFKAVAEGVERKLQLLFLEEIGCDFVQGFYFSKPVSPDKIPDLVKKRFDS